VLPGDLFQIIFMFTEPEQRLLLAEKGGECNVSAEPGFQFVATMNPGGDFGKKEVSELIGLTFLMLISVW
jgi:midasin (ATPase involved in ribosome maturation)